MNPVRSALQDYFTQINTVQLRWTQNLQKAAQPMCSIVDLAETLEHVKLYGNKCHLQDESLLIQFAIRDAVEEKLSAVKEIIDDLSVGVTKLKNLFLMAEKCCKESTVEIYKIEADTLPDILLLEWATDSYKYYSSVFAVITTAFCSVDVEDMESLTRLQKTFIEDEFEKNHVERLVALVACSG